MFVLTGNDPISQEVIAHGEGRVRMAMAMPLPPLT